jgi:protein-tyrosine phosphatase
VRILFVCNANIVRSFMAERIFKSRLMRLGIRDVEVSSAGLLDMQGAPADSVARQVLREHSVDDEGHRSRLLDEEIVGNADLIIVMEQIQRQKIGEQYPPAVDKLRLLMSYLTDPGRGDQAADVKDPFRLSLFHYRLCFAEISLALEEVIKCI